MHPSRPTYYDARNLRGANSLATLFRISYAGRNFRTPGGIRERLSVTEEWPRTAARVGMLPRVGLLRRTEKEQNYHKKIRSMKYSRQAYTGRNGKQCQYKKLKKKLTKARVLRFGWCRAQHLWNSGTSSKLIVSTKPVCVTVHK